MKRILFRVFAFGPLVLLAGLLAGSCNERMRVDAQLTDPSSVVWGDGANRLTAKVEETKDGETSRHRIQILRGTETVYSDEVAINWDLWGGGFVAPMQADSDPEKEIVAYGSLLPTPAAPNRRSFFLDYEGETVRVRPFEEASASARGMAACWVQSHVMGGLEGFIYVVMTLAYYAVFGLGVVAVRSARRRRSQGTPPEKGPSA